MAAQTIAVLVPGITGTTLVRNNPLYPVWPDQVVLNQKNAATLLNQGGITAGAPILQLIKPGIPSTTVPVYSGIVNYFTGKGYTYVTQDAPLPAGGNVLVGFGYDWRQPNKTTAAALHAKLTAIAAQYGAGAQIWLIGHSMGGLVSRYLLESGMAAGASYTVRGLITLGTPHLGAPLALGAITGQCDVSDLLNPDIIEQVVDLPAYPSGFELLPPPQVTFVNDASGKGYSVYTPPVSTLLTNSPTATAPAGFGAPATSLQDAQAFFAKLSYTTAPANLPAYYLVYGSGVDTTSAFTYDASGAGPLAQLAQNPRTGNAAGDGIVPQSSATFTGSWVKSAPYAAPGVRHGQLPSDPGVLAQITAWMSGTAAAEEPESIPEQEAVLVG